MEFAGLVALDPEGRVVLAIAAVDREVHQCTDLLEPVIGGGRRVSFLPHDENDVLLLHLVDAAMAMLGGKALEDAARHFLARFLGAAEIGRGKIFDKEPVERAGLASGLGRPFVRLARHGGGIGLEEFRRAQWPR